MAGEMNIIVRSEELERALRNFQEHSRRDFVGSLNLAGRLWTSFAHNKTVAANPESIRAYLLGAPTRSKHNYRKTTTTKRASIYSGTIAEAIVAKALRDRGAIARLENRNMFYALVDKFVKNAMRSSGYHKAGWIPAMKTFGVKGSKSRGKGKYKEPLRGRAAKALISQKSPHGFLENFARGFVASQKNVLKLTEPEVIRQLKIFMYEDIVKNAKRAGFRT